MQYISLNPEGAAQGMKASILYTKSIPPSGLFNDWMQQRNARSDPPSTKSVPEDLLENGSADDLNHWLSLYVVEERSTLPTEDPLPITPSPRPYHKSSHPQLSGQAFHILHNVIDNHFKALSSYLSFHLGELMNF